MSENVFEAPKPGPGVTDPEAVRLRLVAELDTLLAALDDVTVHAEPDDPDAESAARAAALAERTALLTRGHQLLVDALATIDRA